MDIRPPTVRSSSIVLSCELTFALRRGVPGSGGLSHSKGDPHGDGEPTRRAASSLFAETTTDPWDARRSRQRPWAMSTITTGSDLSALEQPDLRAHGSGTTARAVVASGSRS
jgi:hypothetical protein